MKAGIKVVRAYEARDLSCCVEPAVLCRAASCMGWVFVGGYKCYICERLNIDPIECCGAGMDINTEGSCGRVGP